MTAACVNVNCTYTSTGICARKAEFANPEVECVDLRAGRMAAGGKIPTIPPPKTEAYEPENAPVNDETSPSPGRFWSGLALGGDEVGAMLVDPRTRLFTVMGERNRGKTCFLTALYIQLANGFTSGFPWRFCGSLSLQGFQRLSNEALRWRGGEEQILPRTTHASYRQASFLHLALKEQIHRNPKTVHTLLTDMPGEWFEGWIDHGTDGLPQTLEFLPRSDGFMVLIDAEKLLRDREYKKSTTYLLERLATFMTSSPDLKRPVALILTKIDKIARTAFEGIPIPDKDLRREAGAWGALATRLETVINQMQAWAPAGSWDIFPVASFSRPSAQPVGVLAPLAFLLENGVQEKPMDCIVSKPDYRGSFFDVFREDVLR